MPLPRKIWKTFASGCLAALLAGQGFAQMHPPRRPDTTARRDELAAVGEKLADPDPNARLAYMEGYVNSGDTQLIQKAIAIALRSDDTSLRGLALRGYLASVREITFTVTYPEKFQAQLDAAAYDAEAMKALRERVPWLGFVQQMGGVVHLGIYKFTVRDNTGGWSNNQNHNDYGKFAPADYSFTVSGDRLTSTINWDHSPCAIAVRPAADLILKGTLSCSNRLQMPPLAIVAPIQN